MTKIQHEINRLEAIKICVETMHNKSASPEAKAEAYLKALALLDALIHERKTVMMNLSAARSQKRKKRTGRKPKATRATKGE